MTTDAHVDDGVDAVAADHWPHTDLGNAERLAHDFADLLRYDHARERWLLWDTHRWRPDATAAVTLAATTVVRARFKEGADLGGEDGERLRVWARRSESAASLAAMIRLARSLPPLTDDGAEWDVITGVLGVPNGVVDLHTGTLRDGRAEDKITKQAGAAFDPAAPREQFERIVLEILDNDPASVAYLQRLIGAALTGDGAALQLVVFLLGPGGNGKSLLLKVFRLAFGEYACDLVASVLQAGGRDKHLHNVAGLEGARIVTCSELGDGDELNTERLKQLSGGDPVTADLKYKDSRTFAPSWLMFITTNRDPKPTDNTAGLWRRFRAILTPNKYATDPRIEQALVDELPGILAWCVEGAVAFNAAGGVEGEVPEAVAAASEEVREHLDGLQHLVGADGIFAPADNAYWMPTEYAFKHYNIWAAEQHARPGTKGEIGGVLQPRVPEEFRFRTVNTLGKRLREQFAGRRYEVYVAAGSLRPMVPGAPGGEWRKVAGVRGLCVLRPGSVCPVWHTRTGPLGSGHTEPAIGHTAGHTER